METVIYEQVLDTQGKAMFADLIKVSQALGADPELVLHGGGNTSVKLGWQDITGSQIEALLVKGSGHDLATITEAGFTPLRLARLKELLPPTPTAQECLAQELALAKLIVATPAASVETLVHALIPYPAVVHSHADVILQLTNTPDGVALIKQVLGSKVLIVPYATPGVPLAHACVQAWADASSDTEGLVVLNHGLFTFGATPSAALKQHLELVSRAKDYLAAHISVPTPATAPLHIDPLDLARLRKENA